MVIVFCVLVVTTSAITATSARESVLDRKTHIQDKLILDVPQVPPLCDEIKGLKKEKIDVGGWRLYVEEQGKGIPIVLANGGPGCTHQIFHPFFSQAAKYARVIYYDQRGEGQSDYDASAKSYTVRQAIEDLDNLRKALRIKRWIVVGHSYGGFVAQCYALEHPDNLAGLVLICTSSGTPNVAFDRTRQWDYMTGEEITKVRSVFADDKLTGEQRLYNACLNGDWKRQNFYRPTSDELARLVRYVWKPAPGFRERISSDMDLIDLKGKFASFDIPTLIVEARWDLTWNTDKPGKMQANHPGAKMVVFQNSGHSPFCDEPVRFFSALRGFVKSANAAPLPAAGRMGTRISWPPAVLGDIMAMGFPGSAEQASALLVEAEKAGLADWLAWYRLGLNLYAVNEYEKALVAFEHSEPLADGSGKPKWVFANASWKGIVLDLLSRREAALDSYRKAFDCYNNADRKEFPEDWAVQVGENWPVLDHKWIEERLKTPFERK